MAALDFKIKYLVNLVVEEENEEEEGEEDEHVGYELHTYPVKASAYTLICDYHNEACFSTLTYAKSETKVRAISILYTPISKCTEHITKQYFSILLKDLGLGNWIMNKPTNATEVRKYGIEVSTNLPTHSMLFILTLFRMVDEFPKVCEVYVYLHSKYKDVLPQHILLQLGHIVGGIFTPYFNCNHTIYSTRYLHIDAKLMDIFKETADADTAHNEDGNREPLSILYRVRPAPTNIVQEDETVEEFEARRATTKAASTLARKLTKIDTENTYEGTMVEACAVIDEYILSITK